MEKHKIDQSRDHAWQGFRPLSLSFTPSKISSARTGYQSNCASRLLHHDRFKWKKKNYALGKKVRVCSICMCARMQIKKVCGETKCDRVLRQGGECVFWDFTRWRGTIFLFLRLRKFTFNLTGNWLISVQRIRIFSEMKKSVVFFQTNETYILLLQTFLWRTLQQIYLQQTTVLVSWLKLQTSEWNFVTVGNSKSFKNVDLYRRCSKGRSKTFLH